jgi:hypothetical protein
MNDIAQKTWEDFVKGDVEDGDLTGLHYLTRQTLVTIINAKLTEMGSDLRVFSFDYFAGAYKSLRAYRSPGELTIEQLVEEEVRGERTNEIEQVYAEMAHGGRFVERWIPVAYKRVARAAVTQISKIWNVMADNPSWDTDTLDAIGEIVEHVVSPDEPYIPGFGTGDEEAEE